MMAKFLKTVLLTASLGASLLPCTQAFADSARFDLAGPKLEIRVSRDGKTLPIANVPNLQPADKLWLHPDMPDTQSVRYLLIVAFLRGTTNPPPDNWFFKIETWRKNVRQEGVTITVPDEAQQAILFLAPETGGDFTTLRSSVRARPGVFVRASQDLIEAGFEQARIEKYIASLRQIPPAETQRLADHSALLARTLNLKPNDECFKRPVDLQYSCLTQSGNQTLLDDGHAQSIVAGLASGTNSDFINAASYTPLAGGGNYSAYVGALVDLIRITSGLHTAQYQYIPAIAAPEQESLNLRLNTPPSFRNPKSVIVIGLPAIQKAVPPPLRPSNPDFVNCLVKPRLVLPIEGAPLVYSTAFAHQLVLHLNTPIPTPDIPLTPDAFRGGLIIAPTEDRKLLSPAPTTQTTVSPNQHPLPPGEISGTVSGQWGFDSFTGPTVLLQKAPGTGWKLISDAPLIAGHENHVLLTANGTACVDSITLDGSPVSQPSSQSEIHWKLGDALNTETPNTVDLTLPLKAVNPGALHIAVHQFGESTPAIVTAQTFSEPATISQVHLHAADTIATLTGTNLDQVQQMAIDNLIFTPATLPATDADTAPAAPTSTDELRLSLAPGLAAPKLHPAEKLTAHITLRDGRVLSLPLTVEPSRPYVTMLNRNLVQPADLPLHLANDLDLPLTQQLTFSLKSTAPFPRAGKIEIASPDGSLQTILTVPSGSLVLQNPHTILATLNPLKAFGASAFGPLRLRALAPDGTPGDWLPLATLVRLPSLTNIRCTPDPAATCTLLGSDLYLIDTIAADPDFTAPITVPDGFVSNSIELPRPASAPATLSSTRPATILLYLRLRDDPAAANTITLPILPQPPDLARGNAQPKPGASSNDPVH